MTELIDWINSNPILSVCVMQGLTLTFGLARLLVEYRHERYNDKCAECSFRRGNGVGVDEYDNRERNSY